MLVIQSSDEIKKVIDQAKGEGLSVGLVPTMGALHEGHKVLIRQAVSENQLTVVSIFVNPLQFNNPDDLAAYPRTLSGDLQILEGCGCQVAYCPEPSTMYPREPMVKLHFGELTRQLEGKYRPGHFDGVGLIVVKFFNQVRPHRAYFGLKDYQQYLLIKNIIKDFSYPIELIGVPTVREASGLAMSSRNLKLTPQGKEIASALYKGLSMAGELILRGKGIKETKEKAMNFFAGIKGLDIEYFEVVDEDLQVMDDPAFPLVICIAGYVEGVRLIDNLYLYQD